ncbi:MAG: hypothetical protein PHY99_04615 [Bacteroidales bacterium]|nr:hypothetical protein [Bacteroidales bacterium]
MIRMKLKIKHSWWARVSYTCLFLSKKLLHYPKEVFRAIFIKGVRDSLFRRLRDPKWYQAHWETYRRAFSKK